MFLSHTQSRMGKESVLATVVQAGQSWGTDLGLSAPHFHTANICQVWPPDQTLGNESNRSVPISS